MGEGSSRQTGHDVFILLRQQSRLAGQLLVIRVVSHQNDTAALNGFGAGYIYSSSTGAHSK